MGVSGCGKTTIGTLLANKLSLPFYDADNFHPQSNVDKMRSGNPLDDDDRAPWLNNLAKCIGEWNQTGGAVLACSALKNSYREVLKRNPAGFDNLIMFIYLKGSKENIHQRLKDREGHYMPPELLDSQFHDLEEPKHAITVNINQSPELILKYILKHLDLSDDDLFV